MRNRMIGLIVAAGLIAVLATVAVGAPPASAPTTKAAAKPAATFNQKAELSKYWNMPDSAVVGSVNGSPVTKGELLKTLWLWNGPSTLQDMLTQKMIEQAAKKAKVSISDADLQKKAQEAVNRMGMKDINALLNQYRITYYRFMTGIRVNALAEKTAQNGVKTTDAEFAQWIKARHILIKFPDGEKDQAKKEAAAKAKIDEVNAKVKAGEDFSKLADQYSEDPGNTKDGKKQGGSLGWFTKGRMVKEFEQAAYALKAGEVSEPVKTQYGYHIIKVDELGKDTKGAEREDLRKQIMDSTAPTIMEPWIRQLQSSTKVVNKLMGPQSAMPNSASRPQGPPRTMGPRPSAAPRPAPAPTVTVQPGTACREAGRAARGRKAGDPSDSASGAGARTSACTLIRQ